MGGSSVMGVRKVALPPLRLVPPSKQNCKLWPYFEFMVEGYKRWWHRL
jgi:hypothetical protein